MAAKEQVGQDNYARAAAPVPLPESNRRKPVFIKHEDIQRGGRLEPEDMFKALGTAVPYKDIAGIQKIGSLWRLYIDNQANRIRLITEGLKIRNSVVQVFDRNPFLSYDNEYATRVLIKDIPLSVHESVILGELENKKCKIHGPIIYQRLRVDGKLTQCLTGDRVVFVDLPSQPLPRFMKFHTFKARVFHFGQESASQGAVCSNCLQDGHHKSQCTNEKICRLCRQVGHMQITCPIAAENEVPRIPSKPTEPAVRRKERNDTVSSQGGSEKRVTSRPITHVSRFRDSEQQDDEVATPKETTTSTMSTLRASKMAESGRKPPNTEQDDTKSQSKITGFFGKTVSSERDEDTTEEEENDTSEEKDTSSSESEVMPESPEIKDISTKERESRKRKQKVSKKHKKKK